MKYNYSISVESSNKLQKYITKVQERDWEIRNRCCLFLCKSFCQFIKAGRDYKNSHKAKKISTNYERLKNLLIIKIIT